MIAARHFIGLHFEKKFSTLANIFDTLGTASESDLYFEESEHRYYKRNNLKIHDGSVSSFLNRLLIHNYLFPSTAYRLEGFTLYPVTELYSGGRTPYRKTANPLEIPSEDRQEVRVVVSQPFIDGRPSTIEEIKQEIKSLGLKDYSHVGYGVSGAARIG